MTPADAAPYWLLDSVAGWRNESVSGLELGAEHGEVRLDRLPGRAERVAFEEELARCVVDLATDGCGVLYLLDSNANAVLRKRGASWRLERIEGIEDGRERAPAAGRLLQAARGLAADSEGGLAIADAGTGRVQVFAAEPWPLVEVMEGLGQPWGIVRSHDGGYWIAERRRNRVVRRSASGRELEVRQHPCLVGPTKVACSRAGELAVVTSSAVLLFERGAVEPRIWGDETFSDSESPVALTFSDGGDLYVGNSAGVLLVFSKRSGEWRHVGSGVTGVPGRIWAMTEYPKGTLLLSILRPEDSFTTLWQSRLDGACARLGTLRTEPLDSDAPRCQWHRIEIVGEVPAGTSVEIRAESIEADPHASRAPAANFSDAYAYTVGGPASNPDALVQNPPGRWLRVQLTLRSNGAVSPSIRALKVHFPRTSYLAQLPSVYHDDAESRRFLERFLSLFQTSIDERNRTIDWLFTLFDPMSVPEGFLNWLAGWLDFSFEPKWTLERRRALLDRAFSYYERRGTPDGLEYAVREFADLPFARILEHFRLRRLPDLGVPTELSHGASNCDQPPSTGLVLDGGVPLWSERRYERWQLGMHSEVGQIRLVDCPEPVLEAHTDAAHRFSVFFPAEPLDGGDTLKRVARIVEAEKPVHTTAELCPVYARFRVGVQARVGVDTRIGGIDFMVLSGGASKQLSTLGYDSILGGSEATRARERLGQSLEPGLNQGVRLL
ncbi:MAG TPA: phage tail protein [Polyangiaceae bacterium]|nr:phage tail protein [Polyangiaceae bacterium]